MITSGAPPLSETRRTPCLLPKNRLPLAQLRPNGRSTTSHILIGAPPLIATFLKAPRVQYATHCPSGEKTGLVTTPPASVMGVASDSHMAFRYSRPSAT